MKILIVDDEPIHVLLQDMLSQLGFTAYKSFTDVELAFEREGVVSIDHAIPALTPLPCAQVRDNYTTTMDNQTSVEISIYEGESTDPDAYANGPIGIFELDASPPRPKGQPQISVEFRCDENGRIVALVRFRYRPRKPHFDCAQRRPRRQ